MKSSRRLIPLKLFVIVLGLLVLAAILWPVRHAYGPASTSACYSNLKQLAIGHIMYAADYDERFPDRDAWMDALKPYAKNEDVFICPVIKELEDPQLYGYAFNSTLSGAKVLPNPEKVELVFDSINQARNASGTLESLPNPGRHDGMNNIAYADGSTKAVRTK